MAEMRATYEAKRPRAKVRMLRTLAVVDRALSEQGEGHAVEGFMPLAAWGIRIRGANAWKGVPMAWRFFDRDVEAVNHMCKGFL